MRLLLPGMLAAFLVLPVCGRDSQSGDTSAKTAVAPDGEQLLLEVAQAYRTAPTLTDDITLEVKSFMGSETQEFAVSFGPAPNATLSMQGDTYMAIDDSLFVVRDGQNKKYFTAKPQGNLQQKVKSVLGGRWRPPFPHFALRYGSSVNEYLSGFATLGLGQAGGVRMSGGELVQDGETTRHELRLATDSANMIVHVEPTSKLITAIKVEVTPAGAPEGFTVNISLSMAPIVRDALPSPIAFDPTGLRKVKTLQDLQRISEGDQAPDFTLTSLAGETVTLSDLRGSVVVLDFWATWCAPCKMALPKLQEFASWAQGEGLAVAVFPVDVAERVETKEQKQQLVSRFWTTQGFTMPTLIDFDNSVAQAFGVGPIPHTIVIGPDGTVVSDVHIGYSPQLGDTLKRETLKALNSKG